MQESTVNQRERQRECGAVGVRVTLEQELPTKESNSSQKKARTFAAKKRKRRKNNTNFFVLFVTLCGYAI